MSWIGQKGIQSAQLVFQTLRTEEIGRPHNQGFATSYDTLQE